jgi:hypothetical protein
LRVRRACPWADPNTRRRPLCFVKEAQPRRRHNRIQQCCSATDAARYSGGSGLGCGWRARSASQTTVKEA